MKEQDLYIYRGDSYRFEVTVQNEHYEPLDLAGAEVGMWVKPAYAPPVKPEISVSGNVVSVDFPPALTQGLEWRKAPYDLQISKGGVVKTVLRGFVVLEQDITP